MTQHTRTVILHALAEVTIDREEKAAKAEDEGMPTVRQLWRNLAMNSRDAMREIERMEVTDE